MSSSAGKQRSGIDYSKWDNLEDELSDDDEGSTDAFDASALHTRGAIAADDDMSRAEMSILLLGISYKKDSKGWLKVGHVRVHPDDVFLRLYPPAILKEDPHTFIPDQSEFENEYVFKWGLKDPPHDPLDFESEMQMAMSRTMLPSNLSHVYGKDDNPIIQFVKILEQRKLEFVDSDAAAQTSLCSTYVLKIALCLNEDDVWRRVKVPAAIDLSKLHDQVIVPVMGWSRGYHGYVFEDPKDGATIGPAKYGGYIDMMHAPMNYYHIMDDRRIPLAALLQSEGDFLFYTYDLGDQWEHRIELEEILSSDEDSVVLLDGAGACPPEDSNGLDGKGCHSYADFLAEYKKHPKKIHMKEAVREISQTANNYSAPWMGPAIKIKPLDFDINRHRLLLKMMMDGPSVKKKGTLGMGTFKESKSGCANCGNRLKATMKCAKCSKVSYCSKECQIDNWQTHKKRCRELRGKKKNG